MHQTPTLTSPASRSDIRRHLAVEQFNLERSKQPLPKAPDTTTNPTLISLDTCRTSIDLTCAKLLDLIPCIGWSPKKNENKTLNEFYATIRHLEELAVTSYALLGEVHETAQEFPETYAPIEWECLRSLLHLMMNLHAHIKHDLRYIAGRDYKGFYYKKERDDAMPLEYFIAPDELEKKFGTVDAVFPLDRSPDNDFSRDLLMVMNQRVHAFLSRVMDNHRFLDEAYQEKKVQMNTPLSREEEINTTNISHYKQELPELLKLEEMINEATLLGLDDIEVVAEKMLRACKSLFWFKGPSVEERFNYAQFLQKESTTLRREFAFELYRRYMDALPLYFFNLRRFHKQKSMEQITIQKDFFLDLLNRLKDYEKTPLYRRYTALHKTVNELKKMPALSEQQYKLVHPRTPIPEGILMDRKQMQAWFDVANTNVQDLTDQIKRVYERFEKEQEKERVAKEKGEVYKPAQQELFFPPDLERCLFELQSLFHGASPD